MIESVYRFIIGTLPTNLGMYYLAGFIGVIAYFINDIIFSYNIGYIFQCVIMTIIATFFEGLHGNIFNTNYIIWDYRNLSFSFWNYQCNSIFMLFWLVLVFICISMLDYIDYKCFNGKQPHYMILRRKIVPFNKAERNKNEKFFN